MIILKDAIKKEQSGETVEDVAGILEKVRANDRLC